MFSALAGNKQSDKMLKLILSMNSHSLWERRKANDSGDWRDKLLAIITEGKMEDKKMDRKEDKNH